MKTFALATTLVTLSLAAPAGAAPQSVGSQPPRLESIVMPPDPAVARLADGRAAPIVDQTIWLNKCTGGCMLRPGADNAMVDTTPFLTSPTSFTEFDWRPGEWDAIVKCVQEVYSPFHVNVTDVRPPAGVQYQGILVSGTSTPFGRDAGGFAAVSADCSPYPHGLSFAFPETNIDGFGSIVGGRALGMCFVIAQETAHNLGLDHEFVFTNGDSNAANDTSACTDPMTYQTDCGGQCFFRNQLALCGEDVARDCRCGGAQNSHTALLSALGAGTSSIPAPEAAVIVPAPGAALVSIIGASASSRRGVTKVELVINGKVWDQQGGAPFGRTGQPRPSTYSFPIPPTLPDSLLDISVRAYDDLGAMTESPMVSAYKGSPGGCTSTDACLEGQVCETGHCFYPPPAELGATCAADEQCISGMCAGEGKSRICSQECSVADPGGCPTELECFVPKDSETSTYGYCFTPAKDDGGCSVDGSGAAPLAQGALLVGLAMLVRRRRG